MPNINKSEGQLIEEMEKLRQQVTELKTSELRGKKVKNSTRQPSQPYEQLINSIGGIVWEADARTLQFSFVSRPVERLLGYLVERWLSEPTFWQDHIHPDDQVRVMDYCRKATEEKKDHEFEYRMITADGRTIWLRNIVRVIVEKNQPVMLRGLMVDITERKQTEKAVKRMGQGYRGLFEETSIMYAIARNEEGVPIITDCNELFLSTLGYTRAEVVGQPLAHFYRPESRAKLLAGKDEQALKNHFAEVEHELLTSDGRVVKVLLHEVSEVEADGHISGVRAKFVDISGLKQAEEALRQSEERFRQVISSISDHIYVTEVTEDGERVNLYLSPHIEDLTGYPMEKFMADWNLWPSSIIHPQDRSAAAAQAAQLARGQDSEMEYRLVRADGTVIWVRDRARVKSEGRSRVVYGLVSDITERKRVELEREWLTNELRDINQTLDERVQARTAELQAMLDAVGEGIVVTDPNGVIQYLNPALERLTGYSEDEALGQTPRLWKSNRHDNAFYAQIWQTILAGQTWRGEVVNKRKDGRLYEAVLTITPIPGSDRRPLGFVGVQHDITPFKEMDRMKSEFISTAAHELRTPLTSIRGFSEILLARQLSDERRNRYLTFINQQAEALTAIIDDLLDLSRLEAGEGFEITEVLVDIKEIVEQIIFGFQENYPQHHYRIVGPETWPPTKGDPTKLAQLLKNLFSNATKYSPDGGEIIFQAMVEAEYNLLHLTITDYGIGMSQEQLAHVFDRFYRGDASNTAIGGTGLGMTISRLIVERHGGKIWIESEQGVGTTVHVLLPLPDRPAHILVIEDDHVLQEIQQRHLELQGFVVLTASEGQIGLDLARTCLPNLILLDLALPGMTGFTVLEKLKAKDLTQNIPVIITSAMDKPEEIEKAIANEVVDYLVKPYTMSDLTVRVNRALAKARRETGDKWFS